MDRETMERLLIDRHLGELPPDTHRLLDAYLQVSPVDAAAMDEINSTLNLAAQAIRAESPTRDDLPSPSWVINQRLPITSSAKFESRLDSSLSAIRNPQSAIQEPRTSWLRPLALAASILLAFYVGTRWTREPGASPLDRSADIARLSPQESAEAMDFWSVARYAPPRGSRPQSQRSDSARIEWTSPLVWPLSGEKL